MRTRERAGAIVRRHHPTDVVDHQATVYFNDSDAYCAAWLRNLYPGAIVDERSITDVRSEDVAGFQRAHFFGGIAGWQLALDLAGWPEDREVWTGSCPCQPWSSAGQGRGFADDRDLWPVWFALIRVCRPAVIFGEQVASAAVIGSIKEMQNMRYRQAGRRVQAAQQGRSSRDLPGVREHECSQTEALAIRAQTGVSGRTSPDAPWVLPHQRGQAASSSETDTIRVGLAGDSEAHRSRDLRGDGLGVRPTHAEVLERPFSGSDHSRSRVHAREHASCPVCAEHDGQRLGIGSHPEDCGCDPGETVRQRVERSLAQNVRAAQRAITSRWFDRVRADLADVGYTVGACVVPACAVNAPHIRQRLYWVAESASARRDGAEIVSEHRRGPREIAEAEGRGAAGSGESELADRDGAGLARRSEQSAWEERAPAERGRDAERMGDAASHGCNEREHPREMDRASDQESESWAAIDTTGSVRSGSTGFWDAYELIPCRDGKTRRAQPGLFPLVAGLPFRLADGRSREGVSRAAILRGIGNAICPPLAAEFVRAYLDVVRDHEKG